MSGTLFCNKCGAPNDATAQFCGRCGTALNPAAVASPGPPPAPPAGGFPAGAPYNPSTPYPGASAPQPAATPYGGTPYPGAAPYGAVGVQYGGFWIRVLAAIIDFFIVRVVLFPLKALFGLGGLAASGFDFNGFHRGFALPYMIFGGGVLALVTVGASWLYEALMESSAYQATLGKMILGMKVTDLYGNRISFARATGRHFAKIVSAMILGIGFIMVGFTERKQGLHDMMAGTLVRRN